MTKQEKEYITGLKKGDKVVFEKIFNEYYPKLCLSAVKYFPDMSEAEEVVQDYFCKLWEIHKTVNINTSFGGYLNKSIINHCLNNLRSNKKYLRNVEISENTSVSSEDASDEIYFDELNIKYAEALLQIPDKRREIFELSRNENLKYKDIAEVLGISIKTVETQMSRTLQFLREQLKEFLHDEKELKL